MSELVLETHEPLEAARNAVEAFAEHPALLEIACTLGYEPSAEAGMGELHKFARANLDYRAGGERGATAWPMYDTETDIKVRDLIAQLPLMEAYDATYSHYDIGVGLGAGGRVATQRIEKLYEQHLKGVVFDKIVLLGSARPVSEAERREVGVGPEVQTEYDLMAALFERVWRCELADTEKQEIISQYSEQVRHPDAWRIRQQELRDGTPVFSLSADFPADNPRNRASTLDTFNFLRQVAGEELQYGARILSVTSGPSILYQHFVALERIGLPTGALVETIGTPRSLPTAQSVQEAIVAGLDHAVQLRNTLDLYRLAV